MTTRDQTPTLSKAKRKRSREETAALVTSAFEILRRAKAAGEHEGRITIAAVAAKAGISTALIHNQHRTIADAIRAEEGKEARQVLRVKHAESKNAERMIASLKQQLRATEAELDRFARANHMYDVETRRLRARVTELEAALAKASTNVLAFRTQTATP